MCRALADTGVIGRNRRTDDLRGSSLADGKRLQRWNDSKKMHGSDVGVRKRTVHHLGMFASMSVVS